MTDLLRVRDLSVEFKAHGGAVRAVDGVSFRIRPGSSVAIVGESGSGKSVTAQAILGILPRAGRIAGGAILFADPARPGEVIDLAATLQSSPFYRDIRGSRISMIFQEPMTSLSPLHTIGDQVGEVLRLHRGASRREARDETIAMLKLVGFPDPVRAFDTYPFELSGGLRQRAMIAMAMICRPALLIADEPTTALDVTVQAQILKEIQDLRQEIGMALLLITHDLGVVANIAEEAVILYQGRVMESGMIDDVFRRPQHPYLRALLAAVPHFDMHPGERLTPLRAIEERNVEILMADDAPGDNGLPGRDRGQPSDREPVLLRAEHLEKRFRIRRSNGLFRPGAFRDIVAVDDVSLRIHRGECVGLVGESGCGKSTVSKLIMRAIAADGGRVLFHDGGEEIDLLALDRHDVIPYRRRIQYMFQDPFSSLDPRMTVFEILSEPLVIHEVGDNAYRREFISQLMGVVGLDPRYLSRYPHSFSGGQRQRIGIARALALKPDLIICDEPVSALDVSVQAQILNLLKDLQEKLGLTFLFISHNLAVIDYMADRIMVMCAGRIVEEAPRETLFEQPVHPYTKALLAAVPYPDLDRRLDFEALLEGRVSDPAAWPPPFGDGGGGRPRMIEVRPDHFVRAHAGPGLSLETAA